MLLHSSKMKALLSVSLAATALGATLAVAPPASAAAAPPPSGGYFQLVPRGGFGTLPSDTAAAAMVRRSAWEPRPQNSVANTVAATSLASRPGYDGMENAAAVFGRVTGAFVGTTDETIQWAAAKWGLPDEVIRAEAVTESNWFQNDKVNGVPIKLHGYGDYGHCGGSPSSSGYGTGGPASFGIMQIKWCAHPNTYALSETSTAFNLDYYGAIVRGCLEGWDSWLGNGYTGGDLWGCVGRWFSGGWYDAGARTYIAEVQANLASKPWRSWASTDQASTTPVAAPAPAPTSAPIATPAPAPITAPTPTRPGLSATYYNELGFTGYAVKRTDATVNFQWRGSSPDGTIWPEDYSVRWLGAVTPKTSGYYSFATRSDDGVRLDVHNQRLIENWTAHSATVNTAPRVWLNAGQRYPLRLEYYEARGDATMQLLWSGPGFSTTTVPNVVLSS